MDPQKEATKSMTGQSSYVYSESMNQGTLGISGSYGVSGVSKVKASMSGYVGNAAAKSGKSITVHYNVEVTAGVEYIDFDDLRVSDLVAALKGGPEQSAMASLDAYLAVQAELKTLGTDLYKVIGKPDPAYKKINELFNTFVKSVNSFNSAYGDGLVVGVLWGGFGTVNMDMRSTTRSETWKYGGAANFSYSGIGASVSVAATYDGGQSGNKGDVSVNCNGYSSGACVEGLIDKWLDVVSGKLQEIDHRQDRRDQGHGRAAGAREGVGV